MRFSSLAVTVVFLSLIGSAFGKPSILPNWGGGGWGRGTVERHASLFHTARPSRVLGLFSHWDRCDTPVTVRAGALFLRRDYGSNAPIVTNGPGGPTIVGADHLNGGYAPGLHASARCRVGRFYLEGRYMQGWNFDDSLNRISGATDFVDGVAVAPGINHRVIAGTDFQSADLNMLSTPLHRTRLVSGFRFIRLDDQLQNRVPAFPNSNFDSRTTNDLFGWQLGLDGDYGPFVDWLPLSLNGFVKAGAYYANSRSVMNLNLADVEDSNSSNLALAAELGVSLAYQFTHCLKMEVGYQVLFMDGIAVAAEQFSTTDLDPLTNSINHGSMLIHGAQVNIVGTF